MKLKNKIDHFFAGPGQDILSHLFGEKFTVDDFKYLITLQVFKSPDHYLKMMFQNFESQLDSFLDGSFEESPESLAQRKSEAKLAYQTLNLSTDFEKYFSLMWFSSLPCFDVQKYSAKNNGDTSILKKCFWKGVPLPCSAIFKKVPTDSGMCCAFNKEKADKIFVESKYSR